MKSITVNNENLKRALNRLKETVDRKHVLSALQNVLLSVDALGIRMIASDLEVTTVLQLNSETLIIDEFSMLLPFELIYRISSLVGSLPVKISTDGNGATIECDKDKFELGSLTPVTEYPRLPAFPQENQIKLSHGFVGWLNKATATAAKDQLRPGLCKVCIDIQKNILHVVSTNSHVLLKKSFDIEKTVPVQLLISAKVARALSGSEDVEIFWNEETLVFKTEAATVYAKRSTEKFVKYSSVIPNNEANVEFNRAALINAIEKASVTANYSRDITFTLKSFIGTIRIGSANEDLSRSGYVDMPVDYTGSCDHIILGAEMLLLLLHQISFESVSLAIESSNKAVLIKSTEDPLYTALIMPVMQMNESK